MSKASFCNTRPGIRSAMSEDGGGGGRNQKKLELIQFHPHSAFLSVGPVRAMTKRFQGTAR